MADTLQTALTGTINATYVKDLDLSDATDPVSIALSLTLASGTSANQADLIYRDSRTVAESTPDDLDLAGALSSAFGATLTFAKVRLLYIKNKETTSGYDLTIGGDANAFDSLFGDGSDTLVLEPGGILLLTAPVDGYAVTAGTGDILQLDPGANDVDIDILVIGTSA